MHCGTKGNFAIPDCRESRAARLGERPGRDCASHCCPLQAMSHRATEGNGGGGGLALGQQMQSEPVRMVAEFWAGRLRRHRGGRLYSHSLIRSLMLQGGDLNRFHRREIARL